MVNCLLGNATSDRIASHRLASLAQLAGLFIYCFSVSDSQFLSQETLEEDTKQLLGHVDEDQKAYTDKLAELDEEEKKLQKEIK